MITHISKIARLPAVIREQLNRRLHNGELGKTILPWLNELSETKKILDDLFAGKAVTHQNLSEWRRGGYQDWLLHQQRLEWFDRLSENETEINQHDQCGDSYEATGSFFLFEIGQAIASLQTIKNPNDRCARMLNLCREFARLQNSFNWSRRVQLEWDKRNDQFQTDDEPQSNPQIAAADENENDDDEDNDTEEPSDTETEFPENLSDQDEPQNSAPLELEAEPGIEPCAETQPEPFHETPKSHPPVETEPIENSSAFQAIPPYSPATPAYPRPANHHPAVPTRKPHISPVPIRGRRWECIEG